LDAVLSKRWLPMAHFRKYFRLQFFHELLMSARLLLGPLLFRFM